MACYRYLQSLETVVGWGCIAQGQLVVDSIGGISFILNIKYFPLKTEILDGCSAPASLQSAVSLNLGRLVPSAALGVAAEMGQGPQCWINTTVDITGKGFTPQGKFPKHWGEHQQLFF